jgi:hypothetical protein
LKNILKILSNKADISFKKKKKAQIYNIEKNVEAMVLMEDLRGGVHEVLERGKDGEEPLWNEPSCS